MLAAAIVGITRIVAPAATYQPGVLIDCIDGAELARLKELTVRAIDEAYSEQIGHLYQTWMKDPQGQPRRAQAGASQAIAAWLDARKGASSFIPPQCTVTRPK